VTIGAVGVHAMVAWPTLDEKVNAGQRIKVMKKIEHKFLTSHRFEPHNADIYSPLDLGPPRPRVCSPKFCHHQKGGDCWLKGPSLLFWWWLTLVVIVLMILCLF